MKQNSKKLILSIISIAVMGFFSAAVAVGDKPAHNANTSTLQRAEYTILGPYAHENLAVYLIQSKDKTDDTKYMTLEEALEKGKVIVHETGNVGTLAIENNAKNIYIFIQAGDIVRGGKQDRTIGYDYVVPPKSGKVKLSSFCVERGRWSGRGGESSKRFSASSNQVATREMKLAARRDRSQSRVWEEVDTFQTMLSRNMGRSVRPEASASSLELTLEHKDVKKLTQNYTSSLINVLEGKKNIVGFAFAINGKINSSEIYSSSDIFVKLWPKLLGACGVEAIAKYDKDAEYTHPSTKSVKDFLKESDNVKIHKDTIDSQVSVSTKEATNKVVFETYRKGQSEPIHTSHIRTEKEDRSPKTPRHDRRMRLLPEQLNR
jgi:hypothetical protein